MGLVTLVPYAPGADVTSAGQNSNETAIATELNGNLQDVNCAAAMGLQASKLADAPLGITTQKINDLQVTAPKIADLTITKGKIAATQITKDKLKITEGTQTITLGPEVANVDKVVNGGTVAMSGGIDPSTWFLLSLTIDSVTINVGTCVIAPYIGRAQDGSYKLCYTKNSTGGTGGTPQTGSFVVRAKTLDLT